MSENTFSIKTQNLFLIVFISGFVVFLIGNYVFSDYQNQSFSQAFISFLIYQLYALVMTFANAWFFTFIGNRFSWENDLGKRVLIGFVGSIAFTMVLLLVLRFITHVVFFGGDPSDFLTGSKSYFIFGLIVTFNISLLFHVFYFYKAFSEKKITESQVIAKAETAKYESLKSQLDPHFLFNSLNVLTSLIGENPEKAEQFTTKLSKVYRYVLEQKDKFLIPLDEELQFAHTYMELLKMRFEEAIRFDIPERASHPDLKIVPLSLQILLENAIKHNEISVENPLEIQIFEEEGNRLVVRNRLNKKNTLYNSTRIGLQNIKERYELITERKMKVEKSDEDFKVYLPLLTKKIKIMNTDDETKNSKYLRAQKKVDAMKEFYGSLISYIIFIPFFYFIWHTFTPNSIHWYWFPALGWGIGLIFKALKTFDTPFFGPNWEERKIKEFMEEEKETWR